MRKVLREQQKQKTDDVTGTTESEWILIQILCPEHSSVEKHCVSNMVNVQDQNIQHNHIARTEMELKLVYQSQRERVKEGFAVCQCWCIAAYHSTSLRQRHYFGCFLLRHPKSDSILPGTILYCLFFPQCLESLTCSSHSTLHTSSPSSGPPLRVLLSRSPSPNNPAVIS